MLHIVSLATQLATVGFQRRVLRRPLPSRTTPTGVRLTVVRAGVPHRTTSVVAASARRPAA